MSDSDCDFDFDGKRRATERILDALTRATEARIPAVCQAFPAFAATLFPELRAFREAAAECGLLDARSDLLGIAREPKWRSGLEHEVWRVGENRVLKATYGNCFGFLPWGGEASPLQYLARLRFCNRWFGDCIELVSVVEPSTDVVRVYTLQPLVTGEFAPQEEIDRYLESLGFRKTVLPPDHRVLWRSAWGRRELCVGDLHSKNVIRTAAGGLAIIDGIVALR